MPSNSIEEQLLDSLQRLKTKEYFQTDWDIASFVIFFTFIGVILILIILVLIRCFCCCCCDCESSGRKRGYKQKVGVDNLAMEP